MKSITFIVTSALCLVSIGCASTENYFSNRGRDLGDICTVTIGSGAGLKGRAGPINIGLYLGHDNKGFRNGYMLGNYTTAHDITTPIPWSLFGNLDPSLSGIHSMEYFKHDPNLGGKNFTAAGYYVPFYSVSKSPEYYTQLEVAVGLYKTCRLGINPGEVLDFLLGWALIDIYSDDLTRNEMEEQKDHIYRAERWR